jgi:hypothetical protein
MLFSYFTDFVVSFRWISFSYFTDFVSFRSISFSYFTDFVSFRSISFSYFTDFVGFCFRFVSFRFFSFLSLPVPGNLHHIYADTEILSARLLIILSIARWISTRLPNTILPNFVKNYKISSYYFLFKKKYWWCVHILLKEVIFRAILIRKTIIKCILIVE